MSNDQEFLTLHEAAAELRLSVSTLKRYIYAGQLRSYRTPGGRHRVRRGDLAALLGASARPSAELAITGPTDELADEVAERVGRAIHRRLSRIETDLERLECSLQVIARAARQVAAARATEAECHRLPGECDIRVLGPGCRACDHLTKLVVEVARALGIDPASVQRVKVLDEIAEYGPTPMPALVVNDQVVSAGRLPSKSRLAELLKRCRPN